MFLLSTYSYNYINSLWFTFFFFKTTESLITRFSANQVFVAQPYHLYYNDSGGHNSGAPFLIFTSSSLGPYSYQYYSVATK